MEIIGVKYEDNFSPKTFSGKSYSYYSIIPLEIGDIVVAPTQYGGKVAKVYETNIPEERIKNIKSYLKTIAVKLDKQKYMENNQVEAA